eukprot:355235-Chlamydomonas_euryale.AAC.1
MSRRRGNVKALRKWVPPGYWGLARRLSGRATGSSGTGRTALLTCRSHRVSRFKTADPRTALLPGMVLAASVSRRRRRRSCFCSCCCGCPKAA